MTMAQLPDGLVPIRSTPLFTECTLPAGLRANHCTKEGSWGVIRLITGLLRYEVCDPRRPRSSVVLTPDGPPGIIEPTILHWVEPVGPVEFQVEFWRLADN
jgi:tellurite resistance-related uncharacterized protein